jgi:hypothetical protein
MSRTDYLTLGIVSICIAALAFLIYKIVSLPDADNQVDPPFNRDSGAQTESDTSDYYAFNTDSDYDAESDSIGDDIDDEGNFTPVDDVPDNSVAESTPNLSKSGGSADKPVVANGAYMVLAGSFKMKVYAETAVRSLQKKGYANASVQIFDKGKYAVVLVDRFDEEGDAETLVKKLRQQGHEAQVYKKR